MEGLLRVDVGSPSVFRWLLGGAVAAAVDCGEGAGLWTLRELDLGPGSLFTSCVTLGRSVTISEFTFLIYKTKEVILGDLYGSFQALKFMILRFLLPSASPCHPSPYAQEQLNLLIPQSLCMPPLPRGASFLQDLEKKKKKTNRCNGIFSFRLLRNSTANWLLSFFVEG